MAAFLIGVDRGNCNFAPRRFIAARVGPSASSDSEKYLLRRRLHGPEETLDTVIDFLEYRWFEFVRGGMTFKRDLLSTLPFSGCSSVVETSNRISPGAKLSAKGTSKFPPIAEDANKSALVTIVEKRVPRMKAAMVPLLS